MFAFFSGHLLKRPNRPAMFVAGLLCCCERMWCSIFSTGKRASKSLMQQIKEVVDCFPCMANRTISSNVEELVMQPIGTSGSKGSSRCFSYPSSVKVCRHVFPYFCLVYTYFPAPQKRGVFALPVLRIPPIFLCGHKSHGFTRIRKHREAPWDICHSRPKEER